MKFTLEKLLKIWGGLEQAKPIESEFGFFYGIAKNLRELQPDRDIAVEQINKIISETPEQAEAIKKVNEFLANNEIEVKLYKIKQEYLPKKWNAGGLDLIYDLIEWEENPDKPNQL